MPEAVWLYFHEFGVFELLFMRTQVFGEVEGSMCGSRGLWHSGVRGV